MQTMTLILPCSCWFPQHIDDTFLKNVFPHNRKKTPKCQKLPPEVVCTQANLVCIQVPCVVLHHSPELCSALLDQYSMPKLAFSQATFLF